jgi:hypothetical protein
VAELLRGYLHGKPDGQPVWGGTWASDNKGAEMLRIDLAAAGIPYAVQGPDGPEYADFHALRHTYLTLGGRAGIDLRTLQELAGHSSPTLTARYSHRRLYDLSSAVDRLPNFLPAGDDSTRAAQPLRATGTDGQSKTCGGESLRPACARTEETCGDMRRIEETPLPLRANADEAETLTLQTFEEDCGNMRRIEETTPGRVRTCNLRFRRRDLFPRQKAEKLLLFQYFMQYSRVLQARAIICEGN